MKPLEWVLKTHGQSLFTKIRPLVTPSGVNHRQPALELSLAEMQRMKLLLLQFKLVEHAKLMITENVEDLENSSWKEDLSKFVQAVQEHDYMLQCSNRTRDPCIVTSTRTLDHKVLEAVMKDILGKEEEEAAPTGTDSESLIQLLRSQYPARRRNWEWFDAIPMVGTRSHGRHSSLLQRLFVAAVGAAFLVGPMWLMMVNNGLYTALGSSTAFITVFGAVMAYFLEKNNEVVAGTVAYAAVLVVFVGLVRTPETG